MNLYLITACFLTKEKLQRPVVGYVRNNIIMNNNNNILQERDNSYDNSYAELFKIYGVPAVAIIINNNNNNVIDFIINKNLILMFDAGPLCRYSFYKKYKKYCIKNALHKNDFLII